MATHITSPAIVGAAGNKPKVIEEYFGLANSGTTEASIARMKSPPGWVEPGQTPEFDEFTVVLRGSVRVSTRSETIEVRAGEGISVAKGEWVQYSTPGDEGAEYISVCIPAFSPSTVHRDADR